MYRPHRALSALIPLLAAVVACSNSSSIPEPSVMTEYRPRASAPAMESAADAIGSAAVLHKRSELGAPQGAAGAQGGRPTVPGMIIRTGTASVEVDSLELAIAAVQRIAESLGGWVGNTSLEAGRYQVRSATLELKIPAARYDDALAGLAPIGKVETVSSHAQDVGEEFVDLKARMANSRRLEERLVTLLATRAGKLEDVLAVERELARVREEIERFEGRLRYLETHVATSTLLVTVHEAAPIVGTTPGRNILGGAFADAWRNFVHFTAAVIASLGVVIPVGVVGAAAFAGWRRYRRRDGALPARAATAPAGTA